MGRIISIDYGKKRTGLAWTDPLQIIASGLETVPTESLPARLKQLVKAEEVDTIVLGFPTRLDGSDTHITEEVRNFAEKLVKWFPKLEVRLWDERFTSKMAEEEMIRGGVKKKKRQDKQLINEVSATLILRDYMEFRR
jgi:putative Holliday junction resolvase